MDDSNGTLAYLQSLNRTKRSPKRIDLNPIYPYCGIHTKLVDGTIIYPHRYDLKDKQFYLCKDCNAYCGCHGYSTKPLGMPANAELRAARSKAHAAFDPLWKEEHFVPRSATPNTKGTRLTRTGTYRFLTLHMNQHIDNTHISMFDLEQCEQVLDFVKVYYEQLND